MIEQQNLVAILPCKSLDASQAFYAKLGFELDADYPDHGYRILEDRKGASLHLNKASLGLLALGHNPFGLYYYADNVEALAARFGVVAEDKPWGLREFSVSDPNGTLVRVGWFSDRFPR